MEGTTSVEVLQLVFLQMSARDLAIACCCSKLWNEVGCSEHLWRSLCIEKWPGCDRRAVGKKAIEGMGGYRVFYSKRSLEEKDGRERRRRAGEMLQWRSSSMKRCPASCGIDEKEKDGAEELCGEMQLSLETWEDLTFFVDLRYKGNVVVSTAISGGGGGDSILSSSSRGRMNCWRVGDSDMLDGGGCGGTGALLPRHALTPCFYQGELFYELPFQAGHAANYSLHWSAVRRSDGRITCLLRASPDTRWLQEQEQELRPTLPHPASTSTSTLPLLFHSNLLTYSHYHHHHHHHHHHHVAELVSFACLQCRPVWGASLSHPMKLQFVDLQLGLWRRSDGGDSSEADLLLLLLLLRKHMDWH